MDTFPKIPESVVLEHQIAELMAIQKATGWPFDINKAQELEKARLIWQVLNGNGKRKFLKVQQ